MDKVGSGHGVFSHQRLATRIPGKCDEQRVYRVQPVTNLDERKVLLLGIVVILREPGAMRRCKAQALNRV
jgi:hypothetical protein